MEPRLNLMPQSSLLSVWPLSSPLAVGLTTHNQLHPLSDSDRTTFSLPSSVNTTTSDHHSKSHFFPHLQRPAARRRQDPLKPKNLKSARDGAALLAVNKSVLEVGFAEGQVLEIGLTTTILLRREKFLIRVPNSQFYGQVITSSSRDCCCPMVTKIHLQTDDFGKIPLIIRGDREHAQIEFSSFPRKEAPILFHVSDRKIVC